MASVILVLHSSIPIYQLPGITKDPKVWNSLGHDINILYIYVITEISTYENIG